MADVEANGSDASSMLLCPGSSIMKLTVGDRVYEFDCETAATALLWSEAIVSHF